MNKKIGAHKSSKFKMFELVDATTLGGEVLLFAETDNKLVCFRVCDATYTLRVRMADDAKPAHAKGVFMSLMRAGVEAESYNLVSLFPFSATIMEQHKVLELEYQTARKAEHARNIMQKRSHSCVFDVSLKRHQHLLMNLQLHPSGFFDTKEAIAVQDRLTNCDEEYLISKEGIKPLHDAERALERQAPMYIHWTMQANQDPVSCLVLWQNKSYIFTSTAMLSASDMREWDVVEVSPNASAMIGLVFAFIQRQNPRIIVGHDILFGSFPAAIKRALHDGVYPESISLLRDKCHQLKYEAEYCRATGNTFRVPCPGRVLIDTWLFLRIFDEGEKSFDLHVIAKNHGVQLPTVEELALKHQACVSSYGVAHKRSVKEFSMALNSSLITIKFIEKLSVEWKMLPTTRFFSEQTFSSLQEVLFTSHSQMWRMILWNRGLQRGFYPHMDTYAEGMLDSKLVGATHSTVVNEQVEADEVEEDDLGPLAEDSDSIEVVAGLYKNVALFDFRSSHPSSIMAYNLCLTTINRSLVHNGNGALVQYTSQGQLFVHELCSKEQRVGIIPAELKRITGLREKYKQDPDPLSQRLSIVLKLVANSVWGLMGNITYFFRDMGIAQIISGLCRENYHIAAVTARKHGLQLVYGDSDSVMATVPPNAPSTWTADLCTAINAQVPHPICIQYEGTYDILLLSLRNMFMFKKDTEQVLVKGTNASRRDYPDCVKKVLVPVALMIFRQEPVEKFIEKVTEITAYFVEKRVPLELLTRIKHYKLYGLRSEMKLHFQELLATTTTLSEYGEIKYVHTADGVRSGLVSLEQIDWSCYLAFVRTDIIKIAWSAYKIKI